MDNKQFLEDLISSYPGPLRPDPEYLERFERAVYRKFLTSDQWQSLYYYLTDSFRMFPTISDLQAGCEIARKNVSKGNDLYKTAFQYFEINGYRYARPIKITVDGEMVIPDLPEGAVRVSLGLPTELEYDKEWLTCEQALEQGCISEEFYAMISSKKRDQKQDRFEKIGNIIHGEEKSAPKPIQSSFDDFDEDSEPEKFESVDDDIPF